MYTRIEEILNKVLIYFCFILIISVNISFSLLTYDKIKYYITAIFLVVIILLLFTRFVITYLQRKSLTFNLIDLFFIFFIAYVLLLSIFSNQKIVHHSFIIASYPLISAYLIAILIKEILKTYYDRLYIAKILIICISFLGVFQALIGLLQVSLEKQISQTILHQIKTVIIGTIDYPNGYGAFMAISLVCLFAWISQMDKKKKFLMLLPLLLIICLLILNKSRGAWISSSVTLMFLIYLVVYRTYRDKLTGFRLHFLLIAFFVSLILIGIFTFHMYYLDVNSSEGRLYLWKISWNMIKDNPLTGIGMGNYHYEFLNYQEQFLSIPENINLYHKAIEAKAPNNQYIKIMCEFGVIGGGFYFIFWLTVIFKAIKFIVNITNEINVYILSIIYIIIYLFIHSFVDDILDVVSIMQIATICFVIFLDHEKRIQINYKRKYIYNFLSVLLVIFFFYSAFSTYKIIVNYPALRFKYAALAKLKQGLFDEGEQLINSSLSINSYDDEALCIKGRILIAKDDILSGTSILKTIDNKHYQSRDMYLALAYGELRLNNFENSMHYALKVHRLFPVQIRPKLLLAVIEYYKGNYYDSQQWLEHCNIESSDLNHQLHNDIIEFHNKIHNIISLNKNDLNLMDDYLVKTNLKQIMIEH